MKKLLLFLFTLLAVTLNGFAAETLVQDCTFTSTGFSASSSSYTSGSFTYTNDNDFVLTLTNCNNNNKQWDYVKIGQKQNTDNTATIYTNAAISQNISKVVVNVQKNVASATVKITLNTSTSNSFINNGQTIEVSGTSAQDIAFELNPATGNLYYQLSFNSNNSTGTNGALTVNSIKFYATDDDTPSVPVDFAFDKNIPTEMTVGETYTLNLGSTLPKDFEIISVNDDVATVSETAPYTITAVAAGSADFTAMWDADENFNAGDIDFTITVTENAVDPTPGDDTGEVTFDFTKNSYGLPNDQKTYVTTPATISEGAVNMTLNGNSEAWRYWNDGLRVYNSKSPKFTITVNGGKVTEVSWTNNNGVAFKEDGGSSTITSWTGEAESITFDGSGGSSNAALKTVTVKYILNSGTKTPADIAWPAESYNGNVRLAFESPVLQNNSNVDVTYASSNEAVATVDASNGIVNILASGSTTISATSTETPDFAETTASYTLTVVDPYNETVVDHLTLESFNISGSSYATYTYTSKETNIEYAACAGQNYNGIQLNSVRNNTNYPGVGVTANPEAWIANGVTVKWTSTPKDLYIVTKGEGLAFTTEGDKKGFVDNVWSWSASGADAVVSAPDNTEITSSYAFADDCSFFGIFSLAGTYLDYIDIEWTKTGELNKVAVYHHDDNQIIVGVAHDDYELHVSKTSRNGASNIRSRANLVEWSKAESNPLVIDKTDPANQNCDFMVTAFHKDDAEQAAPSNYVNFYIDGEGILTGVDAVDADTSDAPVEFYDLQGRRVMNPVNGLYIRRQGSTVEKVLVK